MIKYNFDTYSKVAEGDYDKATRFDWCIFLDENQQTIEEIDHIKYYLHPTFPNPERIVNTKHNKFAMFSNGWGNFSINIEVVKNGGEIHRTEHRLRLETDKWPTSEIDKTNLDSSLIKIYTTIEDSKFNWRKIDTIVKRSNLPFSHVMESIQKLEDLNLIRKAHYKSIDREELYGITKKVGNDPR